LLNYESLEAAEEAARTAAAAVASRPLKPMPRPRSGFYGVYAHRKKWQANIFYDGKQHHLGTTFATKQQAACAYDTEARKSGHDKLLNYESLEAAEEAART
jgi:hypothetical protein